MKAITLPPENAALVAAGVQTIITTARRPRLAAGDRLAVHAGTRLFAVGSGLGGWFVAYFNYGQLSLRHNDRAPLGLSLGRIVASAVVRDVVPIRSTVSCDGDARVAHVCVDSLGAALLYQGGPTMASLNIFGQLPLADFTPGRWAVLLDDVAPTTDRCPACWGLKGSSGSIPYEYARWKTPCSTCNAKGACPPIPQRGKPGVWRWEP